MKRVIIVALCLLLVSTISNGQKRVTKEEWKLVEEIENNEAIYIHAKKKITRGGTIKVWTKIEELYNFTGLIRTGKENSVPDTHKENVEWERNSLHSKTLYEFNCKEEMFRVNFVIWYEKGKIITSEQRQEQWKDVVPDSIGESLLKAACKK